MPSSHSQTVDPTENLSTNTLKRLLETVTQTADRYVDLSDRRLVVLRILKELTGATAGYWAWGHEDGTEKSVVAVALINLGFTEQQMAAYVKASFAPEVHRDFVEPIKKRMGTQPQITLTREELYQELAWKETFLGQQLKLIGFEEWLQSIRYSREETWSQLFLLRSVGEMPFQPEDRALIDIAMSSISWLHSSQAESIPQEQLRGLSPRQRAVMLMLLDGVSRKQIASRFAIGEETVGDHIKQIYRHFDINTSGELSALFLRGK